MDLDLVDLHQHSSFSVLDGFPDPDEVVEYAGKLGRTAVALTDHGSVSGHALFEKAIQKELVFVKPIFGIEAYTASDALARGKEFQKKNHLTILAKNPTGYRNLLHLATRSYDEGFYYKPTIDGRMLAEHRDGLIVLSGCETSSVMRSIESAEYAEAYRLAAEFKDIFGDDYYIEVQHFPHMQGKCTLSRQLAESLAIKPVLTCDCHYLDSSDWKYQQFLWSIRDGKPIDANSFKIEMAYPWEPEKLFRHLTEMDPTVDWRSLMIESVNIANKVESFQLPKAPLVKYPFAGDKIKFMYEYSYQFLFSQGLADNPAYFDRLEHEIAAIAGKGYEDYFLVVADMVNWAKDQGIFVGPARGSAAGSLVCWALGITTIDPIKFGLLFERFVDPTRVDLPDIDMDFEDDRRNEVFAYMAEKYGTENVAFISTFARFGSKSALDDVARSYNIPSADIDTIKRHLVDRSSGDQRVDMTIQDTIDEFPEAKEVYERYPALSIAAGIQGKVRHMGKHAAGLVVTSEPIDDYTAVYKSGDERLVAVDYRDAAYLNLMKMDVLGLRELTILRLICNQIGLSLQNLYDLPLDDADTIAMFNRHDFLGVFQFTGIAMKSVGSRVVFESVDQIADVNALSRPGPLRSHATELYIVGRKQGHFDPILPYEEVAPIISATYGQIIYQEQVMRILREIGGLDWQDVCDIRNIMSKSKGLEAFDKYWLKWEAGVKVQSPNLPPDAVRDIWECIRTMGKHSFNKSHAVAYGILAYYSAYMKTHYPTEFYWAQLVKTQSEQNDGRFIQEAMRKGIQFAPISYAITSPHWTIKDGVIYPGWLTIHGIGDKAAEELSRHAPFVDQADLVSRVNKRLINKRVQEAIESNIGVTMETLYHLERWEELAAFAPERMMIGDTHDSVMEKLTIAGQIVKVKKKNRIEEWKAKGQDTASLNPAEPQDYAIVIVQDESDSMMVYVPPKLFEFVKEKLWAEPDGFVRVYGARTPGMQMIRAYTIDWMA